jgi:hypothetical protein
MTVLQERQKVSALFEGLPGMDTPRARLISRVTGGIIGGGAIGGGLGYAASKARMAHRAKEQKKTAAALSPQQAKKMVQWFKTPPKPTTKSPEWVKKMGPLPKKRPPAVTPVKISSVLSAMADELNSIKLAQAGTKVSAVDPYFWARAVPKMKVPRKKKPRPPKSSAPPKPLKPEQKRTSTPELRPE